jgi:hypothetical protein
VTGNLEKEGIWMLEEVLNFLHAIKNTHIPLFLSTVQSG